MASGPSMCEADAEMIRDWRDGHDRRVIAVNTTFRLAPWADVIYAYDPAWWSDNVRGAERSGAELWSASSEACRLFGLNRARLRMSGGNSGYQAARLALTTFGAGTVILAGFDMQHTRRDEHWHEPHPDRYPKTRAYEEWVWYMKMLGRKFRGRLFNASRETAIPHEDIPRVSLEDALC